MSIKKVKFSKTGIENLPNNKPVVYKIITEGGRNNYTGTAQRGRVQERLEEHLGNIPGTVIQIEQMNNISEARKKEINIISRIRPKYNNQSK